MSHLVSTVSQLLLIAALFLFMFFQYRWRWRKSNAYALPATSSAYWQGAQVLFSFAVLYFASARWGGGRWWRAKRGGNRRARVYVMQVVVTRRCKTNETSSFDDGACSNASASERARALLSRSLLFLFRYLFFRSLGAWLRGYAKLRRWALAHFLDASNLDQRTQVEESWLMLILLEA